MTNTVNENGIFNSQKENGELTLSQIDKNRGIPSERLKGLNSIFSTINESSDSVNDIINKPA